MKKNQKAAASNTQGKIFIFNKGICGNGGTTGIIRYAKLMKYGVIIHKN